MSPILQGLANGSVRGYGGYLPLGPSGAFESIASATGTGSSGTITFSSIPSTYQHLQLRVLARDTGGTIIDFGNIRFNSDSGNNYASHYLKGDGSTTEAFGSASRSNMFWVAVTPNNATSGIMGVSIVDIHDYASTTKNKTLRTIAGQDLNGSGQISLSSGLWMNTSAINSISIFAPTTAFTTSTTFALYGIKGA